MPLRVSKGTAREASVSQCQTTPLQALKMFTVIAVSDGTLHTTLIGMSSLCPRKCVQTMHEACDPVVTSEVCMDYITVMVDFSSFHMSEITAPLKCYHKHYLSFHANITKKNLAENL